MTGQPQPRGADDADLREYLGQQVRLIWIAWAQEQPQPKPSWLTPWHELAERDREVDRRIGERLYAQGQASVRQDAAHQMSTTVADNSDPTPTTETRYREALERIVQRVTLNDWRPERTYPTELAQRWSEGHHCGLLEAQRIAKQALDPEGATEAARFAEWANFADDAEYYSTTGHCGSCGIVADNCRCDPDGCGCWSLHGPQKEPYVPDHVRVAQLTERLAAVLAVCDQAERGALRREHPLPVPEWVDLVREAATGEPQQQKLFEPQAVTADA